MTPLTLHRRDDLLTAGRSSRDLATAARAGTLVRVRSGIYVDGAAWTAAVPEARVVARAQALTLTSELAPVISHESAAAAHGLGLFRPDPTRVHVVVPVERPGAASAVVRHRGELPGDEIVEINGLRVTSLARTVADVARTATFDQAVTIADAALRAQFVPKPGAYDAARAEEFRQTVFGIVRRSPHGQGRAKRVLAFADGRAQLPGESVSRIQLSELGFRVIALQVPVAGPGSKTYYIDFGLEDASAWGEFDGRLKYVDGRIVDGRSASQIFDEEKQREDWIRGTTQRPFARWGWPHLRASADLGARLAAFGIVAPG
ncbi:type IV toxin-antitoxin system AbiEi family antitoxin domain-containing protein [Microbacterium kyungheense]|uniref:type IV toxin-antitoxin system AbiEi family antitoxin domain-containing protein n=1 Tax=Microbacterium kyungheense TaxID=1263636 RepID=UPI0011534FE1|nr:hypothetical protein [Microbacterium kyungheense]